MIEIRIVNEDAHNKLVIEHLRRSFYKEAPLNEAVQFNPEGLPHEELEKWLVEILRQNISIAAFENGEVIAVSLNGVISPDDISKGLADLNTKKGDPKLFKINAFLYSRIIELDIFAKYSVDNYFESFILSVEKNARGKGLGKQLVERSIQLAKDTGKSIFKGDITSIFSERICHDLGMKVVSEIKFKDYLDPSTRLPVFDVKAPHHFFKIMILELNN